MKTALHSKHVELGAKMVEFGGWDMPLQYQGILEEHKAVRENVGVFDVSHMGRIIVSGPGAEAFLDRLSVNRIQGKADWVATYTVLPNGDGGSVDDVIIYRERENEFFLVCNAGNREKVWNHLQHHVDSDQITLHCRYKDDGILAVQGPKSRELLEQFFPEVKDLKPMRLLESAYEGEIFTIARTGYTGALGYELIGPEQSITRLFSQLVEKGATPIGLGARDSLRLEMGFALYGHELGDDISALESVANWTVHLEDRVVTYGEAVKEKATRHAYGVVLKDKGIAREGYPVLQNGQEIGKVTSGTQSPTMHKSIALILVDKQLTAGDAIDIQIRNRTCSAEVVELPFLPKELRGLS